MLILLERGGNLFERFFLVLKKCLELEAVSRLCNGIRGRSLFTSSDLGFFFITRFGSFTLFCSADLRFCMNCLLLSSMVLILKMFSLALDMASTFWLRLKFLEVRGLTGALLGK